MCAYSRLRAVSCLVGPGHLEADYDRAAQVNTAVAAAARNTPVTLAAQNTRNIYPLVTNKPLKAD